MRISLDSALLLLGLYLQIKIFLLMQFRQVSLSLAILAVNLAIASTLTASVINLLENKTSDLSLAIHYDILFRIFDDLKVMFTFSAFMFNLYRWWLFIISHRFGAEINTTRYKWILIIVTSLL